MNPSKAAPSQLRFRQAVSALTPDALGALRSGISKMLGIADDRGYAHWAGIHGLPLPISCHHGDLLFLPWHRAYLYFMEQYLLDQEPTATLPWWDWTERTGVPPAYGDPTLPDGAANPLASAPITGIPANQFTANGVPHAAATHRHPGDPADLPSPAIVQQILELNSFDDFSHQLESQVHNLVHVWTGGTMSMVPLAAFDPIFWAHHCMIDRLWALWQLRHPGAGPDPATAATALAPFPMTVAQTADITALGYQYAQSVGTTTA